MDDCELDLLVKELEADQSESLKIIDRELEKRTTTTPVDDYIRHEKVGQGTFGEVFKVQHKVTKEFYALKRLRMEKETEGFPVTALREVRILQSLRHENVVGLEGICHQKNLNNGGHRYEFFLLFELCDHDLAGLLNRKIEISLEIKKSISKQLLTGIQFLHNHNILHRDLKASNILIARNGCLKIADFGLARRTVKSYRIEKHACYTARVVTLWYRPPEILLMDRNYGKSVDLWGAGCIIAELWTRGPLMPGDNEMSQLNLIMNLCGSITPAVWPGVDQLDTFKKAKFATDIRRNLREKLAPTVTPTSAIDLIDQLLVLDPRGRLTAEQALQQAFFREDPPPGDLSSLSQNGVSFLEYFSTRCRNPQTQQQQYRQYNNGRQGVGGIRAGGYRVVGATGLADCHQQQHEAGSLNYDRVY